MDTLLSPPSAGTGSDDSLADTDFPSIDELLMEVVKKNGSDLHLRVNEPPIVRVHGHLERLPLRKMTPDDTQRLMYSLMNEERQKRFEKEMEMDMSHAIPGIARFRVNVLRQRGHVGGVLRLIPTRSKTIDELELPQVLKQLSLLPRGLVLVTGPTGSGKSTTLAACIDHINRYRRCHIITIEDPIEFVHEDNLSAIEQRELGQDTHSFADALKHVMRQAPDVILVGEMRDLETIALAITAAETGHLVFATLHTTDAPQTIDRIIDVFPPEQQEQVRTQLAVTLQAVVSQTLLPLADRPGRIPAFEIMIATPAIRSLVREAKTHQIYSMIETGADYQMISLDQYLLKMLRKGTVTIDHAMAKSSNPKYLLQRYERQTAEQATMPHGTGSH
ncbi:MAG: type IV pilus twitching motility protein PilT [Capsulimonadales bacterium]|nr:type IV pilus twitching motility protein PilT [Capsulimonadales bacterium]